MQEDCATSQLAVCGENACGRKSKKSEAAAKENAASSSIPCPAKAPPLVDSERSQRVMLEERISPCETQESEAVVN